MFYNTLESSFTDIITIHPVSCKLLHLPTQGSAVKSPTVGSEGFLRYPGGHSEMQVLPSPASRDPSEHAQWKDPGVFTHAFAHGPRPAFSLHSSRSVPSRHKHIAQENLNL